MAPRDIPRWADRAYGVLLRAYPREFREDVGAEMRALFRDRYRDVRARGRLAVAALWARTLWDTARNAAPERLAARGMTGPGRSEGGRVMDRFLQDVRYAIRALAQRPGFTTVAVLTIALGVGANTAIFSLVNAVLLRPLPYPEAERLVVVWTSTGTGKSLGAWPEYLDWRAQSHAFEEMAAWRAQSVNLTGGAEPERVRGAFVSASFFDVVGARARLGRTFRPEETDPATTAPAAVISHGLWTRRFGADPSILGRTLVLNGQPRTVIGVMGPEFEGGGAPFDGWFMGTEAFLPVADFPNAKGLERGQTELLVTARLRRGVSVEEARTDLALVAARLEKTYPDTHTGRKVLVVPIHEQLTQELRPALFALLGAVGLVLLIACANVANLMLARAAHRQREMALRSALGADRRRLVAQLLTESLVLAAAAGVVGAALGYAGVRGLEVAATSQGVIRTLTIDRAVLGFTIAVSLGTGLAFGVFPALQASRPDLVAVLREGGRSVGGAAQRRVRDALVVAEVAVSLMLLVGAGLLLRTVAALHGADPGFRPERLLTLDFRLPPSRYAGPAQIAAFYREIQARMRAVPGVESVGLARAVPFGGNGGSSAYEVDGAAPAPPGREPRTQTNIVSPDYFRTMGIPILKGRDFDARDTVEATPVAVVSASLAHVAWPGQEAIGKRLRFKDTTRWLTVVGVVGDVKQFSLTDSLAPYAYTPHDQDARIFTGVVARTAGDPASVSRAIREAIWSVDPEQPVWKVASMESQLERSRGPSRTLSALVAAFAGVALLLAAIGIYGVMANLVAMRTREIGIRMALGASARTVVGMVVGRGMALTLLAIALGAAGAAALTRTLSTLLFGVGPLDPLTFAAAAVVLGGVALLASYLPARRAARVDPVVALAEE